jgi:3-polyprenyl-4-hydroxybenzoate decarboxylase
MSQQSLAEYVSQLDKAGLLTRIKEEKRVDELPKIMEDHPDTAVPVEKVKDCAFPFFANGYGVREQYALALEPWPHLALPRCLRLRSLSGLQFRCSFLLSRVDMDFDRFHRLE